ncbi:LAFE_0B11408g1_1 [Lachancea fermentati]|uniref:Pheromone-regulated membrane protein 10 n=1 Tax=Lachancea fermentati TaxID=4955 RepID=A0A1G4M903_LACFM|nr:LAFE_0B11408g1_1 [Lachancea fermentati]
MIVSFGDATTRTSEVQLVRCNQGLNLWKLHQVHSIYKLVIHDLMSVEEANSGIDAILAQKNLYPPWVCVLLYGFCSSMVTPFAFSGDWINMATSFFIGTCVGCLQFIVSQRSNLYSNVFEVTASIVVSFCGRALGSIPKSNICFGATVQGSLALILPGYIILCGSLELQSRNIVAGAVRMFYAIIYSLFLGFGITLGAALFGWLYHDATNETTCAKHVSPWFRFIFVPAFSIGLALINQARWTQIPVMTFISCCGYVVTYFSGLHFKNSTEFTSAMAAFIIGILGNFYSRIWKGLAVSAMLPGIFVQVPSGVASQSSLLAGVQSANEITNSSSSSEAATADLSSSMSFGITMIQVSIGISVGLFASTLFVYPFGKKKTGLFTL